MRRIWTYVLSLTMLLTLVSADALAAKKSRGAPSHAKAKRQSKSKHAGAKLSRRDRRARGRVAIRGKAIRGKRGRRLARSRRGHRRTQYVQAIVDPVTARPSSGISSERATEIQNALIKAGYMDGPASGQYDEATIEAMKDFQAANKMPVTGLPSAPALKKLGVPKRSSDGYAVPVNKVSETDKKHAPQ